MVLSRHYIEPGLQNHLVGARIFLHLTVETKPVMCFLYYKFDIKWVGLCCILVRYFQTLSFV